MPTNPTVDSPAVGSTTRASAPGRLQRLLFWWFVLAVLWIIVGKSLFGAVGWLTAIMLFTVAPFLLVYGAVLWAVVKVRNKRSGYIMSRTLHLLVIALLVILFVFGFTIIDGGDTKDSGMSALTSIFGINSANGANSPLMDLSGRLSGNSIVLSILLLPTILGLAVFEKRRKS